MNEGLGKDLYRKGISVRRSGDPGHSHFGPFRNILLVFFVFSGVNPVCSFCILEALGFLCSVAGPKDHNSLSYLVYTVLIELWTSSDA